MARLTREESKARTRARLMDEANRLFLDQGYGATTLEEIAEAAEVTRGAIYRHFDSKEALLLSIMERSNKPADISVLYDLTRPLTDRFADLGRALGTGPVIHDTASLALQQELLVAALRNPAAMEAFSAFLRKMFEDFIASVDDPDDPERPVGLDALAAMVVIQALHDGLRQYQAVLPDVVTPDVFSRAFSLLAGLYTTPEVPR